MGVESVVELCEVFVIMPSPWAKIYGCLGPFWRVLGAGVNVAVVYGLLGPAGSPSA